MAQVARDRQEVSSTQMQLKAEYQQDNGQIAVWSTAASRGRGRCRGRRLGPDSSRPSRARRPPNSGRPAGGRQFGPAGPRRLAVERGPVSFNPPPPVGSGAAGAVAAAESRVGDPYVWGASGPSTFDCSGLVMWSYAQVGISLPHLRRAVRRHDPYLDGRPAAG